MKLRKAEDILGGLDATQNKRMKGYMSVLSTDKDKRFFDKRVLNVLAEFQLESFNAQRALDYLNELGYARNLYEYAQLQDQLLNFSGENHPNFSWNRNFKEAKTRLMKEFKRWGLKMVSYRGNSDVIACVPKKQAHAGFSFILTGLRTKESYFKNIYECYSKEEKEALIRGSFNKPILCMTRTQGTTPYDSEGNETGSFKAKSRLVSAIDIWQILAECRFARPIQIKLSETDWYAGGRDDDSIQNRLTHLMQKYGNSMTIDYSKFDQTISDWLIREAFDVIRAGFSEFGFDEDLFSVVREDFIHKVFIDGSGRLVESHKGVPSGSMFTQIVDSIVNKLMVDTYFISKDMKQWDMMIMGDDNIIFTTEELEDSAIGGYLNRNFGVSVSWGKTSHAKKGESCPEFLSRVWTPFGVYREPHELFARMLFPERWRDYSKSNDLDPAQVVYAYILTFPLGMRELIDVPRFEARYAPEITAIRSGQISKWASGLMRFRAEYLNKDKLTLPSVA